MGQIEMRNRETIRRLKAQCRENQLHAQVMINQYRAAEDRADALEGRLDDAAEYLKLVIQGGGGTSVEHEMEKLCEALEVDWNGESKQAKDGEV